MDWMDDAYAEFNKSLFFGKLPRARFSCNVRRKCILDFLPPNNIQVGSEFLEASDVAIVDELIHTMVHLFNHKNRKVDHTANQYHNHQFKTVALAIGLHVVQHKNRGWAVTLSSKEDALACEGCLCPTDEAFSNLQASIERLNDPRDALANIRDKISKMRAKKPNKQYQLKYVCKCEPPNNSIRSGRRPDGVSPLNIVCNVCKSKFVLVSESS